MYSKISLLLLSVVICSRILAHPTGNMIVIGEYVLWSYIYPVDDSEHHACVMIWSEGAEPTPLITSEFPASDFMLYNRGDDIYLIERKYNPSTENFETRMLKAKIGEAPEEIWPWFEDDWRVGEGGFLVKSDEEIVFSRYPEIYTLKKGGIPKKYFNFSAPLKRMRAISSNRLLLLGDKSCWLTDHKGNIIEQWENLIDEQIQNAPLNRNQIFDADYRHGELLIAYWGNRSFDLIDEYQNQTSIKRQEAPWPPHWVAFWGNKKLLFSSKLDFNGDNPQPKLMLVDDEISDIWKTE